MRFEEIRLEGERGVVLWIPAAKISPVSFAEERYIRTGYSKEKLIKYSEKESFLFSILRDGYPTIENTESEYRELTFEKLQIFYGAKGIKLNWKQFEKNVGLYTSSGKYNIMVQLLSDD